MTVAGSGRVPGRKRARRLQDLVRPPQFGVLLPQPTQLIQLTAGALITALAPIGLVQTDPVAQRRMMHTELHRQLPETRLRIRLI
jgi:hypothetical protein